MSLEARISGPIFQEALAGIRERKSVEEGRLLVPGINETLNGLVDNFATKKENGEFIHNDHGWVKISMYVIPHRTEEEIHVSLTRHIKPTRSLVHIFVEGLDPTIHVGSNECVLRSAKQIPQKGMSSYELDRIPTGTSSQSAPYFDTREANLEEVMHIKDFVGILTDPSQVKQVKGLTS